MEGCDIVTGPFQDVDYGSKALDELGFMDLDAETLMNPYPYFRLLRERAPAYCEPRYGVYLVSRYEDVVALAKQPEKLSSVIFATGPLTPLPERLEGESVDEQIQRYRDGLVRENIGIMDPPMHKKYRMLVNKLFSPKRLKELDGYIEELANSLIDEFIDQGEVEFIDGFAGPVPFLVVADLLGVPREDHGEFKKRLRGEDFRIGNPNVDQTTGRKVQAESGGVTIDLMEYIFKYFCKYVQERRDQPTGDLMTQLALATFPDSDERPTVEDVAGLANILFGAGQETTVRLFTTGMQILLERPDVEQELRKDPSLIPGFVEECLRFDTPVKGLFRVAREDIDVSGVTVPAGSTLMLLWGAANRDPNRFPDPDSFDLHREDAYRTLSFGQGIHFCPGAPLARREAIVGWQVFLSRIRNIRRKNPDSPYEYLPSFIIRGLSRLDLEFEKA